MITIITAMTRSMSTSGSYPCDGHRKRRDVCQGGIASAAIDGLGSERFYLGWTNQLLEEKRMVQMTGCRWARRLTDCGQS